MNILFRVDASKQIGTGHVMRCMTLAKELRNIGAEILFISREFPGHFCDVLISNGFDVIRIDNNLTFENERQQRSASDDLKGDLVHSAWLGVDQETDAQQTLSLLPKNTSWDWLVVDHYALDARWEAKMRKAATYVLVIDDLADRKHDCDYLLDQNFFHEPYRRYKGLLPKACQTLLGPKYALLRPEFRKARKFARMRGNGIARVLIFFGGNDQDNLTGMCIEALMIPEFRHIFVETVIGHNNPHIEKLEKQVKKRPGTRLHIQTDCFAEIMLRSDLFIGAGGATTWERLCLGIPSIVITVAKNQEEFTEELDNYGFVKWIGKSDTMTLDKIIRSIFDIRCEFKEIAHIELSNIVDGKGAERVLKMITT